MSYKPGEPVVAGCGGLTAKPTGPQRAQLVVHLPDNIKSLVEILRTLEEHHITVNHLETRPSGADAFDVFLDISASENEQLQTVIKQLSEKTETSVINPQINQPPETASPKTRNQQSPSKPDFAPGLTAREELELLPDVPWFPTTLEELIKHSGRVLQCGEDLNADHPSFSDASYRARRKVFTDISNSYALGRTIPHVDYSKEETETWGTVYRKLTQLYPSHACTTFNQCFALMVKHCGFNDQSIPQMEDVSNFLRSRTGFRLRPTSGLVDWRDYLAGLAFRVFHATQYIRHHSLPEYTPEPDVCHEFLGHVPLFCDPEFAQFCQEIGMASLAAPDEWIAKLGNLYWYTVEVGLCRESNCSDLKVYGGALLSSFGELEHCLTDSAAKRPLETDSIVGTPYPITRYQDVYYVADSFQDARDKLAAWVTQIPRPFTVRYNAFTSSIEILHKKEHLQALVRSIDGDMKILKDAINKLQ